MREGLIQLAHDENLEDGAAKGVVPQILGLADPPEVTEHSGVQEVQLRTLC